MGYTTEYEPSEPMRAEIDALPGPVLVEFGAPWCPHCHAVQPVLAELLRDRPDVKHIKIHDGKGQPLGRSFRVKLWPTLVWMRDGQVVHRGVRPSAAEMSEGIAALGEPKE